MPNKVAYWTGVIYRIGNDAVRDGDEEIARELRDFLTGWLGEENNEDNNNPVHP